MSTTIDHYTVEAALRRCGSHWRAAQAHGLCCSRLAARGPDAAESWLRQVLEDTDPQHASCRQCRETLRELHDETYRQLAERQSEFSLLLPDEQEAPAVRAAAMAEWCEGFLHGLVLRVENQQLKKRLASEPLAGIIRDVLEITRAAVGPETDEEGNERAYMELIEYLRVTTQLVYEELASFRKLFRGGADWSNET